METTFYFVASEALANIAKHSGASQCTIVLQRGGGTITLAVADNGIGGAGETPQGGLRGLRDRVEALGGSLEISTKADHGTTLTATIPLDAATIHHA